MVNRFLIKSLVKINEEWNDGRSNEEGEAGKCGWDVLLPQLHVITKS